MMLFREFLADREDDKNYTIARYLEYKAVSEGVDIEEAARRSMARLFSQLQDNAAQACVIITAFRGDVSLVENRNGNKNLAMDIRSLGWGFTPVLGGFVETSPDVYGQPQQNRVHEESFFVTATGDSETIQRNVVSLLKKYHQEAALLKLSGKDQALYLNQEGSVSPIGQWKADPKLMAVYYTRMRQGRKSSAPPRQFAFEAAGNDSVMTRTVVDAYFRNKKKS